MIFKFIEFVLFWRNILLFTLCAYSVEIVETGIKKKKEKEKQNAISVETLYTDMSENSNCSIQNYHHSCDASYDTLSKLSHYRQGEYLLYG
jgi:hypothetical protein